MQIQLNNDILCNIETPTFILAYKDGHRIGQLTNISSIKLSDDMSQAPELAFTVSKYDNGELTPYWDKLTTFKLVYCVEYNTWFEATVEYIDSDQIIKQVNLVRLSEAELSMVNVYSLEVNTEADITRDDYVVTKLYNPSNRNGSLLNRVLSFAPHYHINYVDESIQKLQSEYSFNNQSVYDCLNSIAEKEHIYIDYEASLSGSNKVNRGISAYDLYSNCRACGHRGNFTKICPKCGSSSISEGYGKNTTICVTKEDLGREITLSDNVDQIRNCYHIAGGDDLMTDTVRNCNLMGGKSYLWRFTEEMKQDMTATLAARLSQYEEMYAYVSNTFVINPSNYTVLESGATKHLPVDEYNTMVERYQNVATEIYQSNSSQLKTQWDNAVAARKAEYPDPSYICNVDIHNRPMLYNSDGSYSISDTQTIFIVVGDTLYSFAYTTIMEDGTRLTNADINSYIRMLIQTPDPIATDRSNRKILYRFERGVASQSDSIRLDFNGWADALDATVALIYRPEGEWFVKYNQALDVTAGVGNPTSECSTLLKINNIVGFPNLIKTWYDVEDTYEYLKTSMMPIPSMYGLTAQSVADGLTSATIKPATVSTKNLSLATANTLVLNCAKIIADSTFKVEIHQSSLSGTTWTGTFKVTSLYDTDDVAYSSTVVTTVTTDMQTYVNNSLETKLYNVSKNDKSIIKMLHMDNTIMAGELKKYSLTELTMIRNCFLGCAEIIAGLATTTVIDVNPKIALIDDEIVIRETDVNIVANMLGVLPRAGQCNSDVTPFGLKNIKIDLQQALDLESFLDAASWVELNAFRREEDYSDDNYISDNLEDDNGELIKRAYELLQAAEQQMIENNAHSYELTATLKNLLMIPEFEPLKDSLQCGNWIRIMTSEDEIYKLRLTKYEFDFDNPAELTVTFSDITNTSNIRETKSLMKRLEILSKNPTSVQIDGQFSALTESLINSANSLGARLDGMDNDMSLSMQSTQASLNVMNGQISMKIGADDVISAINMSPEGIKIQGNRITLEGYTSINNAFNVSSTGTITMYGKDGGGNYIPAIYVDGTTAQLFDGGIRVDSKSEDGSYNRWLELDGSGGNYFDNIAINAPVVHVNYQGSETRIYNCDRIMNGNSWKYDGCIELDGYGVQIYAANGSSSKGMIQVTYGQSYDIYLRGNVVLGNGGGSDIRIKGKDCTWRTISIDGESYTVLTGS